MKTAKARRRQNLFMSASGKTPPTNTHELAYTIIFLIYIVRDQICSQVWRTLALYVIAHMKAGYFDGLKSINKHPPLA
ncbi:hypothetical protein ANCDUO_08449 [Ancylostoma duodenale]|uniref:Uncharacterized protein n=1 Tax=Ancylostoma duodenale TaxID=51022 RepID=A0A0C2GJA4_9BILA|nr:hypothetical protein ANCDUO_08449 [Ancylostoma duodenale]